MKTDEQIVAQANMLAAELAAIDGYKAPPAHPFSEQANGRETKYWRMACVAFEALVQTSPDDALSGIEEAQRPAQGISMQEVIRQLAALENHPAQKDVLSAVHAIMLGLPERQARQRAVKAEVARTRRKIDQGVRPAGRGFKL